MTLANPVTLANQSGRAAAKDCVVTIRQRRHSALPLSCILCRRRASWFEQLISASIGFEFVDLVPARIEQQRKSVGDRACSRFVERGRRNVVDAGSDNVVGGGVTLEGASGVDGVTLEKRSERFAEGDAKIS